MKDYVDPRTLFADDEFTFFRVKLLEEVKKYDKPYTKDLQQKEQIKADNCLTYLMNYRPHQQEF